MRPWIRYALRLLRLWCLWYPLSFTLIWGLMSDWDFKHYFQALYAAWVEHGEAPNLLLGYSLVLSLLISSIHSLFFKTDPPAESDRL
jgi:hypothetical protein